MYFHLVVKILGTRAKAKQVIYIHSPTFPDHLSSGIENQSRKKQYKRYAASDLVVYIEGRYECVNRLLDSSVGTGTS